MTATTARRAVVASIMMLGGAMQVTGSAGTITLSPTSWNSGQVVISGVSQKTITIKNSGSVNVTVNSLTVSGANSADFRTSGTFPKTLAANQTTTFVVTFTPSFVGDESASVAVASTATGSPAHLGVGGTGFYHSVTLNWTPGTQSSCYSNPIYNVYRGSQSGGPYTLLTSSPISSPPYVDTPVSGGDNYYYVVTTVATYTNDGASCTAYTTGPQESSDSNEAPASVPSP